LCRLNKFGIRFTSEKQRALLRGDTSGVVVHPFFVYGAQVLGMYFCENMENSTAMIRLRAKNFQACFDLLMELDRGNDWELRVQIALWNVAGSIFLRLGDIAYAHARSSCEIVDKAGLQFIPTYGKPPVFSEELHEKLSVLSQIIYFENFLFLTCGGAEPTMTAKIEMEFRHQLRVRPATSFFTSLVQRSLVGSISGIVQDMSVDHAHANYFAGQRHGVYTQPSSN